jgi:hypothetical protein
MLRQTGALLILMVLAFAATGCDEVTVDYDQDADFSAYQTFAWQAIDPDDKRLLERDFPKAAERIKAAINRELTSRGLHPAAMDQADLMVSYEVHLDVKRTGQHTGITPVEGNTGVSVWSTDGRGDGVAYQEPVKEGTLIFRMEDRSKGKQVWQGQFSRKFRNPSELEPADIRQAIKKLFRDFPRQG